MASKERVAGSFASGWQCGIVCLALGIGAVDACLAQEAPVDILVAHLRQQGLTCDTPRGAERDAQASKPHATVWTLTCGNAVYRVTLVPDMKARVEVIKK